jgi:hypothetical protein
MDITDLFRRRKQAEVALSDPILVSAFEDARQRALVVLEKSRLDDYEGRELAYQRLKALEAVKHELARYISEHQVEKARLDLEEKRADARL